MTQTFPCGPPIESSMVYGVFLGSLRCEAFYTAYESPDRDEYPNLVLTGQSGLDVIVFDSRCPESVLKFLLLVCKSSCLSTSRHIYIYMYVFVYFIYIFLFEWILEYLSIYTITIYIYIYYMYDNIATYRNHVVMRLSGELMLDDLMMMKHMVTQNSKWHGELRIVGRWCWYSGRHPRITYHNAFHQGAQTSFMEMIIKVPEALGLGMTGGPQAWGLAERLQC